jgi:D-lactate dehydrogenase
MVEVVFFSSKNYVEQYFNSNNNFNFKLKYHNFPLLLDNISLTKGFDVACLFVNDIVNADVLYALKNNGVKLIALRCAGYNNVDLATAKKLEIPVVRVPRYSPYAVAEHTMAMILTLNRKTHKAYNRVKELNFAIDGLMGFDLNQKTIGVIGTGAIGSIFIKIAKGFGMKVLAYDVMPNEALAKELDFKYTSLEEIYKQSNIITLFCPLTKDNHHLINSKAINLMEQKPMIVNTSRGGLIDATAIIKAIKNYQISAIGLDVYEEEEKIFFEDFSNSNITDDVLSRLISFNNVLITSHQAFFTTEAVNAIANTTLGNIDNYFNKKTLTNQVV